MNKSEFTDLVQSAGGYKTKTEASIAVSAFITAVTEGLVKKEEISLVGFGKFFPYFKKGKTGKIPGSEKTYTTKDAMVPKFKTGKQLKDRVAAGK